MKLSKYKNYNYEHKFPSHMISFVNFVYFGIFKSSIR